MSAKYTKYPSVLNQGKSKVALVFILSFRMQTTWKVLNLSPLMLQSWLITNSLSSNSGHFLFITPVCGCDCVCTCEGWWGGCNKIYMKGTKEEIVIITYINPQNFLYAIHMVQATYYFPDHCVQARTETPTRHNTSMNIVWLKIHLNNIEQQTSMTIIWFLISSIPTCKKHTKQTKTHTRWRGPARRKCVPLGLFLWTTICKSKDKDKNLWILKLLLLIHQLTPPKKKW